MPVVVALSLALVAVLALVVAVLAYRRAARAEAAAQAAGSAADDALAKLSAVPEAVARLAAATAALEQVRREPDEEPWRVERGTTGADAVARVIRRAPTAAHGVTASAKDASGHYSSDSRNLLPAGEAVTLRLSDYSQRADTTVEVAWSEPDGARTRWTGVLPAAARSGGS